MNDNVKIWSPISPPEPDNDNDLEPMTPSSDIGSLPPQAHNDKIIDMTPYDEETAAFAKLLEDLAEYSDPDTEIQHIDINTYKKAREND